jgi:glycosyltransferase involved in cell wall biosynthesis
MAAAQVAAIGEGATIVTCSAPLGQGGLGRHVEEIADAVARRDGSAVRIASAADPAAPAPQPGRRPGAARAAGALSRVRAPLSPGLRAVAFATEFDAYAAQRLPRAENLIAFNGQAVRQLRVARAAGYRSLQLVSANSHMRRVVRQHERARKRYPLEGSWTRWLLPRNLREYERCDTILYASQYIRESFLEEGVPEERLRWFPLTPHPRYDGEGRPARSGAFEVVYSGSLAVHKGVPLLVDVFRALPYADMRLVLNGGWGTRGMRRFVQAACAADPRISAGPGDPRTALETASLCVHPAYEDGFAYAPAEALVRGVPVIVSEDTGMKDMIDSPEVGAVIATGDERALGEAIEAAYRGELFGAAAAR